jgi:hypothetical protein
LSIQEPDELGEPLALDPELDPEFDEEEEDEPESLPLGTADPVVWLSAGRPRSCAQAGDRLSVTAAAASPIENRRSVITSPSPRLQFKPATALPAALTLVP